MTNLEAKNAPLRNPIGVFDSGVGGLTVLREIIRQLPAWDTLYIADNANCPYGRRPVADIRALSEGITRYLLAQGACCIVVACNSASAAALHHLREAFTGVPFVGMVPAVKPATALTQSRTIGVLATPTTLNGQLLSEVIEQYAGDVRILTQECPGLVEQIEAGDLDGPATDTLLRRYLQPLLAGGADVIALGCTHYPFLAAQIQRLAGPKVRLLDPSEAVARQVQRVLAGQASAGSGRHVFKSTGEPAALRRAAERLLGIPAEVGVLQWEKGRLG